jgi:hypothetical protein
VFIKTRSLIRDPFKTPLFKTNLGSFSFLNIAIKILNSFLYDDLDLFFYVFNNFIKIIKIYLNLSIFVLRVKTLSFRI